MNIGGDVPQSRPIGSMHMHSIDATQPGVRVFPASPADTDRSTVADLLRQAAATIGVAAASPTKSRKPTCPVKIWLIDTGCGHDLSCRDELRELKKLIRPASRPINFHTANGTAPATTEITFEVCELGDAVTAFVLPLTPNVLSVGSRRMRQGYSFHWFPGESPYFVTPSGNIVMFEVLQDIPHLRVGDPMCQPCDPTGFRSVPHPSAEDWAMPAPVQAPLEVPERALDLPEIGEAWIGQMGDSWFLGYPLSQQA